MQCRTRQPWNIRYPKSGTITAAQKAYVGRYTLDAAMLRICVRCQPVSGSRSKVAAVRSCETDC